MALIEVKLSDCKYQESRESFYFGWFGELVTQYFTALGSHEFGFSTSPLDLPLYLFDLHEIYTQIKALKDHERRKKEKIIEEQREMAKSLRSNQQIG